MRLRAPSPYRFGGRRLDDLATLPSVRAVGRHPVWDRRRERGDVDHRRASRFIAPARARGGQPQAPRTAVVSACV